MSTLKTIRSTDPRFGWIASELGVEPDRHLDLATMINNLFADKPAGEDHRAALLPHLEAMIEDMRTLNLVEELFDIVVPCEPDPHRLWVLLQRMGWSGEFWYTEQEAAYALHSSVNQVRNERAKLVRVLRRGPVWAPVLHRCAAILQELVPLTQTQFKVVCGIELEGKWSMNLWGFLSALDLFGIDHWFHLENVRTEPILYCDLPVDFGYQRKYLDDVATDAERRIAREIVRQRRLRREEQLERQRYLDPWEVRPSRRPRRTDVGVRESPPIYWWEIPQDSELRANPDYDDLQFGSPLVMSRIFPVLEPNYEEDDDQKIPPTGNRVVEGGKGQGSPRFKDEDAEAKKVKPDVRSDLVDLKTISTRDLLWHFTGAIDREMLNSIEANGQQWTPILEQDSASCIGVVRTSRLRNKLSSGVPEIRANDPKIQGVRIARFACHSDLVEVLSRNPVVYFNEDGVWGVVFRND